MWYILLLLFDLLSKVAAKPLFVPDRPVTIFGSHTERGSRKQGMKLFLF